MRFRYKDIDIWGIRIWDMERVSRWHNGVDVDGYLVHSNSTSKSFATSNNTSTGY